MTFVPVPIPKTEDYPWQEGVIGASTGNSKRALFAAPRLGKTRAVVKQLRKHGFTRILVVAPLVVCGAWVEELESRGFTNVVEAYNQSAASLMAYLDDPAVVVINYDKLAAVATMVQGWKPEAAIFDESHYLKNPQSNRSKAARKVVKGAGFVRVLTGTPSPNHYGDLWGQMVLVNPAAWGATFSPFAQRYLVRDPIYPSKVIAHQNVEELQAKLLADADIVRREDVFGPDTYQVVERLVVMPYEAQLAYNTLVREWVYHHERGEVDAAHTLKRLTRLQQLTSGYLRTEEQENIQVHSAKLSAVLADLDEIIASDEKAVIFHRFTWEGELYEQALRERFPSMPVWRIYGETAPTARTDVVNLFREHDGPCIVVAQTKATGIGISLAEATHALFVSQSFSFTDEHQARDRIYKPGENRCITYYRCAGTVDDFVAAVIDSKSDIHTAVTRADIEEMAYGDVRRTKGGNPRNPE